jgi:hypothetical protein
MPFASINSEDLKQKQKVRQVIERIKPEQQFTLRAEFHSPSLHSNILDKPNNTHGK